MNHRNASVLAGIAPSLAVPIALEAPGAAAGTIGFERPQ